MGPKEIEQQLLKQYKEDKYGELHKALEKGSIETDLYVGIGIEMYHPTEEEKVWCFNVFDEENMVVVSIWPKRLSGEQRLALEKAMKIARGTGYKVRDYGHLSQKQLKKLGLD